MEQIITTFQAYRLTAEELANARKLSAEQRAYYQTLLSSAAEEKLAQQLDPENPMKLIQQEAYIRGQMDILSMLLNESDDKITRPNNFAGPQPNVALNPKGA